MKGRALILPPVNRNDAKVTEQLSDLDDSRSQAHCAMQYRKGRAIPIALDQATKRMVGPMPSLLPKRTALMVFALPMLILAGCSDSLISTAPSPPNFTTSNKALDKTLTPEQRKAAIADLQSEQAKRQGASQDGTTASVNPVQAQN
jgi:hypothetical protein